MTKRPSSKKISGSRSLKDSLSEDDELGASGAIVAGKEKLIKSAGVKGVQVNVIQNPLSRKFVK